jgi:hypothetical protein
MKKILITVLVFLLSGVPALAQRPIPAGGGGGAASSVSIAQGGNTAQVVATSGGSLQVSCVSGCGGSGGTSIADDAAFTVGTTNLTPVGGTYKSVRDSVNDNDTGAFAMTITRALYATLEDASGVAAFGTAGSSSAAVLTVQGRTSMTPLQVQSNSANLATEATLGTLMLDTSYAGSFGIAGTADPQVRTVQGIASMTPLQVQSNSANLATETTLGNVLTSSNFAAAFGTAGSADTQVMSVQGIASGTALTVDSEMAAAAALADATANPTTTGVAAYMMSFNGTTWDRAQLASDKAEDAAHSSAATGPFVLSRRIDTLATSADTSGDYAAFNTNASGALWTAPTAATNGGADGLKYTSAGATEDEHAVKASAGTLYSITATNTNAAVRYIRCENDTAANTTPGSETPELDLAIPGATTGAGITFSFPVGFSFSTALTCWLVTGAADTDVAEVAANEIKVFYSYK